MKLLLFIIVLLAGYIAIGATAKEHNRKTLAILVGMTLFIPIGFYLLS